MKYEDLNRLQHKLKNTLDDDVLMMCFMGAELHEVDMEVLYVHTMATIAKLMIQGRLILKETDDTC